MPNKTYKRGMNPNSRNGFQKGHKINTGKHTSPKTEFKKGQHASLKTEFKKGQSKPKNACTFPKGDKHPAWKGGKSFEPYTVDWTQTLKRAIRERDNYICQLCNQYGNVVHHIDYDKKNCNPNNLIILCQKCHTKTNYNREYWIKYFLTLVINKNGSIKG